MSVPSPDNSAAVVSPEPSHISAEVIKARVPAALFERLRQRVTLAGQPREMAPVLAPFTGEPIADVPVCTPEDVAAAVQRARRAQRDWAARSFKDRARVFLRLHDLILKRQETILDIIQLESGKARKHALEEVLDVAIVCRHYAHHGEEALEPKRRRGALPALTTTWEHHQPLGVVAFIAPWNYPLSLAVTDAIPALLAGNAVILKPDQLTPFTALWTVDLLDEAGLPSDLFHVLTGRGRELGGPMIDQTNFICFTGSTDTGRKIGEHAGRRLIGCSLELGGKNPMLVLEDADLDRTVEGAVRACYTNSGQLCISIERMYVQAPLYDRFLSRFGERARRMRLGAGFDYDIEMGSLASKDQLDKTRGHVDDAVGKGATAVAGGRHRPDLGPYFFEPTILTGVTDQMAVAREETFGPVVSIHRVDSVEEAIQRANDTNYGLNASIWTRNTERGRDVATRIQAGTVNINEGYAATWASVDAPMGGFKDSGLGRRHGDHGILKYTEAQTISVQHLLPLAAPSGVSEERYGRTMTAALKMLKRVPGLR